MDNHDIGFILLSFLVIWSLFFNKLQNNIDKKVRIMQNAVLLSQRVKDKINDYETFKDGVLEIEIPKPEEQKPKQVQIKIE